MNDLAHLRARIDAQKSTIRKCGTANRRELRKAWRSEMHSEFCAAFAECGMDVPELARHLGLSKQFVDDMVKGNRPVPSWVLRGMPKEGRIRLAEGLLVSVEHEPSSRTGTMG